MVWKSSYLFSGVGVVVVSVFVSVSVVVKDSPPSLPSWRPGHSQDRKKFILEWRKCLVAEVYFLGGRKGRSVAYDKSSGVDG
jgi:hypothetical protein